MTISQVFLHFLNISITASWLVLAIALFRLVFKKAPKYIICALWALVAIRLIFPISIESNLSLIPSSETIPLTIEYSPAPAIDTGISSLDTTLNPIITESFAPKGDLTSMNPIQLPIYLGAYIWQMGIVIMLCYALVSYIIIRTKVRERVETDKNIYICDRIPSPFILGIIRPKIYLPSHLNEEEAAFVIAHEKAHIKRLDFLWKPLGFILLTIYWFNPVIWLGYILLCRDIEYACDEKVIREMSIDDKKSYSETLLNLSIHRPYVTACPLAFGESGVKSRIKSVLNYKKPTFWVIIIALIVSIAVAVCFLTNPPADNQDSVVGTYYTLNPLNSSAQLPFLTLNDDGTFVFEHNASAHFILRGYYQLTDSELTLYFFHAGKGQDFVFDIVDNGFSFNAQKSTADPVEYLPDGTVLLKGFAHSAANSIDYDIDNDGIEEFCVVDYALILDVNAIEIRVYENNTQEYYETLIIGDDTFSFEVIDNSLKLNLEDNTSSLVRYFDLTAGDGELFAMENLSLLQGELTNHPNYIKPDEYKDGLANVNLKKYYHDDIVDVMNMTTAKQLIIKYFNYDFNRDGLTDKFAIVSSPLHSGTAGDSIDILINNGDGTYTDTCDYNIQLLNGDNINADIFVTGQHIIIKSDKIHTFVFDGEKYELISRAFSKTFEDELYNLAVIAENKIEHTIDSEVFFTPGSLTYSSLCERMEDFCHGNAVSIFLEKNTCIVSSTGDLTYFLIDYRYEYSEYDRNDFTLMLYQGGVAIASFKRYYDKSDPTSCKDFHYIFSRNASGKYIVNDILVEENGEWVRVSGVW